MWANVNKYGQMWSIVDTGGQMRTMGDKATSFQHFWLQVMQVLESQMSGQAVKPEVSAEERVERCREKQGLLESRSFFGPFFTRFFGPFF